MSQMALEQSEPVDREACAPKPGMGRKESLDTALLSTKTRKRDVRQIGAVFRRSPRSYAGAFHLALKTIKPIPLIDAHPQIVDMPTTIEGSHPAQRYAERSETDTRQSVGHILRLVAVDGTDEAQREMQLIVILPARPSYARHDRSQQAALIRRGTARNEQAMHHPTISGVGRHASA